MIKQFVLPVLVLCCMQAFSQNYDENKVPDYKLPDPLITLDNKQVTNRFMWESLRRPEILSLFEKYVYGKMPEKFDSIQYNINKDEAAMDGKARLKEVIITVFNMGKQVSINLVLFIPSNIKKPAPAFLLINNRKPDNTDPKRIIRSEFWPAELLIDSGYAVAAFNVSDAAPDINEHYMDRVLQLYPDLLHTPEGMKAIGCWAWAASRVMDYFETDKQIDSEKIALAGHSRGGKAALWAGAQDTRFAIVFSNNSGNTGAALSRRRFGETIKIINTGFPYWFNDNYKKYNDNEDSLPVDQHMLIALMAPRPVYVTSATKDLWADPKGSFLALKHAENVYALYNKTSSLQNQMPPVNTPVIESILGYHIREGEHDLKLFDWKAFSRFATFHFNNK